jgi:hypothetical protein
MATHTVRRPGTLRAYLRSIVAITLLVTWAGSALTGFLLWLAPTGQRSGREVLLLGLTKHGWRDIHFWVSVAVAVVTIAHIIIDWRALRGCVRYLTTPRRDAMGAH